MHNYNFTRTHTDARAFTHTPSVSPSTEEALTPSPSLLGFSVTVEEMSLQRSCEGWNGITFPDASRQCIPERWSNIPEGSMTVLFCLRMSWPRNIMERS